MTTMKSRCSGFSLIELLVAIGLAAILAAAAVPAYSTLIKDTQLTTAASDFHNMLFKARSEAVKRGQTVQIERLTGQPTWSGGALIYVDTDGDGTQDAGEATLWRAAAVRAPYSIAGVATPLRFLPTGVLTVSPAIVSFTLCNDNTSGETGRSISISQTGRPSVTDFVCS